MELSRIPWPGPRPYDEGDWDDFYGRDSDLGELIQRVRYDKLTILLGASGTGKTSLLRAGLVPILRQQRYQPKGDQSAWPVLLLRRWGARASATLTESLLPQIDFAIDAIDTWGDRQMQDKARADAASLRSDLERILQVTPHPVNICEVIQELARAEMRRSIGRAKEIEEEAGASSGLILIFDQFEELLRAGHHIAADAVRLIGDLFHSGVSMSILLSLRREYRYALRRLEFIVGGLAGRTLSVAPMRESAVMEVVKESSERSGLPIEKAVAERIVRSFAFNYDDGGEDDSQDRDGSPEDESKAKSPNLLHLQGLLLELSRYALMRGNGQVVTMELFEEFVFQFVGSGDVVSEGNSARTKNWHEQMPAQEILQRALERWIEAALVIHSLDDISALAKMRTKRARMWARMTPEELDRQARRICVRLAPLLSSGDLKILQEENTLFRQALGDDIARLGIGAPELWSRIRVIAGNEVAPPRLNWEELGLDGKNSITSKYNLSGVARAQAWSLIETGDQIAVCFKETLDRLAKANILQFTRAGPKGEIYWELVHDQFGPVLMRWAGGQKYTWEDCRSSLVASQGIHPIGVPFTEIGPSPGVEYYDLNRLSWLSCGIVNHRGERLRLRNVRFLECNLAGTIFDSVDFVGCCFSGCDLTGSLFRDCTFREGESGQPMIFMRCKANMTILHGLVDSLEFRCCHLFQPAIIDTLLEGGILFSEGSKVLQGFYDVKSAAKERTARIRFDSESIAVQCAATPDSFKYLEFENQEAGINVLVVQGDFLNEVSQGGEGAATLSGRPLGPSAT